VQNHSRENELHFDANQIRFYMKGFALFELVNCLLSTEGQHITSDNLAGARVEVLANYDYGMSLARTSR